VSSCARRSHEGVPMNCRRAVPWLLAVVVAVAVGCSRQEAPRPIEHFYGVVETATIQFWEPRGDTTYRYTSRHVQRVTLYPDYVRYVDIDDDVFFVPRDRVTYIGRDKWDDK